MKFSIIPIQPKNKKPIIPAWKIYQEQTPTIGEVKAWWSKWSDAMIGIVTGSISDLAVIDVDTEEGKEELYSLLSTDFQCPMVYTPNGMHLYCRYPKDLRNKVRVLKGLDIRAEAGYVIAPPSKNFAGKQYKWDEKWRIPEKSIPEFPKELLDNIDTSPGYNPIETGLRHFQEGRRDDDLFRAANLMLRGGASKEEVSVYIKALAAQCNPPFPEREAERKVESAVQRAWRRDHKLVDDVKEYLSVTEGSFSVTEIRLALQLVTKEDRANLRQILYRLAQEKIIERNPIRDGVFRMVTQDIQALDWKNAPVKPVEFHFLFGLTDDLVEIFPGNIIVLAGNSNTGKTAAMLNLIKLNQDIWDTHFFSNEMGETELKLRLDKFGSDIKWNFKAYERSSNYEDVIVPNGLNLIDYMEISDTFYSIASKLRRIHDKLEDGLAVIAIQKSPYKDLGRGADFGTEVPRLYLTMESGKMRIVKAKNWKGIKNPNGLVLEFKLRNGCEFSGHTWHEEV